MSAETKKVLEMLAAGKISPEDAERLLNRLSSSGASEPMTSKAGAESRATDATGSTAGTKKPRFLRIQVERPGKDNVNMRVPLSFVRSSQQLMSFLPPGITEKLQEHGIGIGAFKSSRLDDPEFQSAIGELDIDIDKGDGKKIRIFAE